MLPLLNTARIISKGYLRCLTAERMLCGNPCTHKYSQVISAATVALRHLYGCKTEVYQDQTDNQFPL